MDRMAPGGGGRFAALAAKIGPGAAAAVGRKKYGKARFQAMAAKGRKRHARHEAYERVLNRK